MKRSILFSIIVVFWLSLGGYTINQVYGQNPRTNPDTNKQKNKPHKVDATKLKKSTKTMGHDTTKKKKDTTYHKPKKN